MTSFSQRVAQLPTLGLGVSTEYGARRQDGALDPAALRRQYPDYGGFLEVGVEVVRGLDDDARAWADRGWPTTYHFLDVNLDEPADLDDDWLGRARPLIDALRPAWICGDAGLWHFGGRERGHMLLLPPVLIAEAAAPMAAGIIRLREATGLEVLPENPPGAAFVGDLHILEFFARVADAADCGLLVDCAHLAMFQRARGLECTAGFADLDWDRVVELHIAGGSAREVQGLGWVDDDHGVQVLGDTWTIAAAAIERAVNLRAIVVECERNPIAAVAPIFARAADLAPPAWTRRPGPAEAPG